MFMSHLLFGRMGSAGRQAKAAEAVIKAKKTTKCDVFAASAMHSHSYSFHSYSFHDWYHLVSKCQYASVCFFGEIKYIANNL